MKSLCTVLTHKLQSSGILPDDHDTLYAAVAEAMHEIAMGLAMGEIALAPMTEDAIDKATAQDEKTDKVASTMQSLDAFISA